MKLNYEYELKLMLTKHEYEALLMEKGCDMYKQTNYYFDTAEFDLYTNNIVVRIREKNQNFELTVKNRGEKTGNDGILSSEEKNLIISKARAEDIIEGNENIRNSLSKEITAEWSLLKHIGKITTYRKKIHLCKDLPLAELDKNVYADIVDYELEWEISEIEYIKAVSCLEKAGIFLVNRKRGLSKCGRLIDILREGR